jgi:hypothetical protein
MTKDEIIKKLEEDNLQITLENKKLKQLIHSIKDLLDQDSDSFPA